MKLRLRDRVHAVIFAYESGLLQTGKGPALGRERTRPVVAGCYRFQVSCSAGS